MADSIVSASTTYVATVGTGNSTVSASTAYVATVGVGNSIVSASFVYVATAPPVVITGGGVAVPGTKAANASSSGSNSGGGGSSFRAMQPPSFNPTSILEGMDGTVGYVQWRAYIGPPFRASTASDFYDWSALTLASYTPSPSDTTLSSGVSAVATVANLTSAASFPSAGGLWLGPNAVGESWGYATYTGKSANQLTGLTRDTVDAEYTGVHTSGAVARFWWPLETATAEPVLRETMDNSYSTVGWDLQIGGIVAPIPAMRASHLFLMQIRELSGGAWGNWTNWLIGWTLGGGVQDNADKERPWTLQVAGLNGMLSQVEVTGLRVGPPDIADNANIIVSSTLSPAYKEANTGEFTGSDPDIGSGSMIDNSVDTPWISGGFVGENNVLTTSAQNNSDTLNAIREHIGITQVHVNAYPGQSEGYRWFEVTCFSDVSTQYMIFAGYDYEVEYDFQASLGDRIIFAENPILFDAENPENSATVVDLSTLSLTGAGNEKYTVSTGGSTSGNFTLTVTSQTTVSIPYNSTAAFIQDALEDLSSLNIDDVRVTGNAGGIWTVTFTNDKGGVYGPGMSGANVDLLGGTGLVVTQTAAPSFFPSLGLDGAQIFDYLSTAGGMLRMYLGPAGQWQSQVVWGTAEPFQNLIFSGWVGSALSAPTAGQTARMLFFPAAATMPGFPTAPTTSAEYWQTGGTATPGYNVLTATKEWLYFDLPTMGLSLSAAINSSVTSIVIAKEGLANVDGLPATGTIQVGIEQITYTAINRTTGAISGGARGANSTTAVSHLAGDTVYFVNAGVATEAYPVDTIQIQRPSTATNLPEDFIIRGSELALARKPDEDNYTVDYTTHATVTNNTATTYSLDLSGTAPRIRYLVIEVTEMVTNPSRVKINEIRVLIDGDVLDSSKYLATGTVAAAMDILIQGAGVPAGATTDGGGTQTVDEYTTQTDLAWLVIVDLAEFTNTRVTIGRDSKITFESDPFWGISGTPSEASEITRTSAAHVEINKTPARQVGQVELTWRPPTTETEDVATFPTTYTTGRKMKIGPYVYADATVALAGATKRYYQIRRPYDAVVELATQGDTIRAGTVRGLNWILHDSQLASDRTYLCIQAAHTIKNFGWNSVLTLLQLTRTDEL